ncbi:MAG: carbonic anhydrase [Halieaceae bacterium]|nr:carbonic anhydrase [Halieaceae bacterium]
MLSSTEALQELKQGNQRFLSGTASRGKLTAEQRRSLAANHHPFAVILGCADSRVPAELIFDQGFGDLFVVRVAGNIAAPSQTGSVEFAVQRLGARLVVVLGHTHCAAVEATLNQMRGLGENFSQHLEAIVRRIRPAFSELSEIHRDTDPQTLLNAAVRANIQHTVKQLRGDSSILQKLAEHDGLCITGAVYCLETGDVEFLDEISQDQTP